MRIESLQKSVRSSTNPMSMMRGYLGIILLSRARERSYSMQSKDVSTIVGVKVFAYRRVGG